MRPFRHWTENRAERTAIAEHPKFKHFVLPSGRVTTDGRVLRVDYGDELHETLLRNRYGLAIAVAKDPARTGRIIVIRRRGTAPFGEYYLNSLWRSEETPIGGAELQKYYHGNSGYLLDLRITKPVRRKANSLTQEEAQAMKAARAYVAGGDYKQLARFVPQNPRNEFERLLKQMDDRTKHLVQKRIATIKEASESRDSRLRPMLKEMLKDPNNFILEDAHLRRYAYRRRRLAVLLVEILANEAREHGLAYIYAHLRSETSAKFLPRYGWEKVRPKSSDNEYKRSLLEELPEL